MDASELSSVSEQVIWLKWITRELKEMYGHLMRSQSLDSGPWATAMRVSAVCTDNGLRRVES